MRSRLSRITGSSGAAAKVAAGQGEGPGEEAVRPVLFGWCKRAALAAEQACADAAHKHEQRARWAGVSQALPDSGGRAAPVLTALTQHGDKV